MTHYFGGVVIGPDETDITWAVARAMEHHREWTDEQDEDRFEGLWDYYLLASDSRALWGTDVTANGLAHPVGPQIDDLLCLMPHTVFAPDAPPLVRSPGHDDDAWDAIVRAYLQPYRSAAMVAVDYHR